MEEKITRTVKIENSELTASIFGSYDVNVRMLERAFSVVIRNRSGEDGDAVLVSGDDSDAVRMAAEAVGYLKDMAKVNDTLTDQQVGYVIEMLKAGNESELAGLEKDCICITTRGKPIKAKTVGQRRYVDAITQNTIVFGVGPAGTGKTFLAVAMAVKALREKQVSRIILTRPAIEAERSSDFCREICKARSTPICARCMTRCSKCSAPRIIRDSLRRERSRSRRWLICADGRSTTALSFSTRRRMPRPSR